MKYCFLGRKRCLRINIFLRTATRNASFMYVLYAEHFRLIEFLSSPHGREGDLFKRKIIRLYPSETFQTTKNVSTLDQIDKFGRNYVSIGYVDLSPLLWGIYHDEKYDNPTHFYGYDANLVFALGSKIVLELLKWKEHRFLLNPFYR